MTSLSPRVAEHLPSLRRYACAFAGSRELGDTLVCLCLEAALAEADRGLPAGPGLRQELLRLLHRACSKLQAFDAMDEDARDPVAPGDLQAALGALPPLERAALLLVSLERLPYRQAADVLDLPFARFCACLFAARRKLNLGRPARVLIVEDEAIVAMDLQRMLTRMGHEVCGIAPSRSAAVAEAMRTRPTLMLADVRLQDGDDGIAAADEIHRRLGLPVVFVTAYGEALAGRPPGSSRVVHKPFIEQTLAAAIRSALSSPSATRLSP